MMMSGSRRWESEAFCLAQREKVTQSAHANGFDNIIMADTFEEAFEQCVNIRSRAILNALSPACAN